MRRWIAHADDCSSRFAEADRIQRHLRCDAERSARRHWRECRSDDFSEHGDLRRRNVGDVPEQIRGHARPRLIGASPFLVQRANAVEFSADAAEFCRSGRRRHRLALNRSGFSEVLLQRLAPRCPERFPRVLRIDPFFGADREFVRFRRRGGIDVALEMPPQWRAALRRRPELVPATQRPLVMQRLGFGHSDVTESGADINVRARFQRLQIRLDSRILTEGLNERADGELRHRSHLVVELRELRRRKTLGEPPMVCFKIELGFAYQKIGLTVTAEGCQPAVRVLEIPLKCFDVRGFGGDDAPAENADALALRHGRVDFS